MRFIAEICSNFYFSGKTPNIAVFCGNLKYITIPHPLRQISSPDWEAEWILRTTLLLSPIIIINSGFFNNYYYFNKFQVFIYKLTSSCDYSRYRFICNTQTDKITEEKVLFVSSSIDGPIVTGCESKLVSFQLNVDLQLFVKRMLALNPDIEFRLKWSLIPFWRMIVRRTDKF